MQKIRIFPSRVGDRVLIFILGTMARRAWGSAAPSYSHIVIDRGKEVGKLHFKKPLEKILEARRKGTLGRNGLHEQEWDQQ